MRVAAALSWYDEPLQFLARLVLSLDGVVDELVALDGAWQHFPHSSPRSNPEQVEIIRKAAEKISLPVSIGIPDETFESQVAKRSELYRSCCDRFDWILVIDGDEFVEEDHGFHEQLERANENDIAMVALVHNMRRNGRLTSLTRSPRRVFRTKFGLSVREAHNGVVTDDNRWLAGPRRVVKEPALDLTPYLKLNHEANSRGEQRNTYQRRYYDIRARKRIEVH